MGKGFRRVAIQGAFAALLLVLPIGCSATSGGGGKGAQQPHAFGPALSRAAAPKQPTPTAADNPPEPQDPQVYLARARTEEQRSNLSAAEAAYRKAAQLDPKDPRPQLGLARLADRQGKLGEAERLYRAIANQFPSSAAAWNDLGLCYARQSRWQEAAHALHRAVALAPNRQLYHNNLGIMLVKIGEVDAAVKEFSQSVGEGAAHYNAGYLLMEDGEDIQSAHQFLLAALKDSQLENAHYWLNELAERGVLSTQNQLQATRASHSNKAVAGRATGPVDSRPTMIR